MTLTQLRYVLAAIEHGSFSAAAEALHLAQPSLSQQVRALERELGVELFARTGRRLALTEAGRALRPEAERTIAAAERAAAAVVEVRELSGGSASFGMFGDAPSWFIGNIVAAFRRRHPQVRVRIVGTNSSEVADAVRAGDLEAGLIVLPVDEAGLDVRPLMRDELLYVSADEDRVRRPVRVEDLPSVPLVFFDARWGTGDPSRHALVDRAQRVGVRLDPVIEVEELSAALNLAARGMGDTIVSETIVLRRTSFPSALGFASFDPPIHHTFAVIHRRDAPLSPASEELITLAEQQLRALGERDEA